MKSIISSIAAALTNDIITKQQAAQMRMQAGIFKSDFTTKRKSKAKRKRLRILQREARRRNRGKQQGKKWTPKKFAKT